MVQRVQGGVAEVARGLEVELERVLVQLEEEEAVRGLDPVREEEAVRVQGLEVLRLVQVWVV